MTTKKEYDQARYRREVSQRIDCILQNSFPEPYLLRLFYDERPDVSSKVIENSIYMLMRRVRRRRPGAHYAAYVSVDKDSGVPVLNVLLNIPRRDCFTASRAWYNGRVELIQPDAAQLADFAQAAKDIFEDDNRTFRHALLTSRSIARAPEQKEATC